MFRFEEQPINLDRYWQHISDRSLYGDSGICRHMPILRMLAESIPDCTIVELGIGGGDQSTIAWLAAKPKYLYCIDVNRPDTIPAIKQLAASNHINFTFHQGTTAVCPLYDEFDILFVDTWHDAATVKTELALYAPLATKYLVFHDVVAFGWTGQGHEQDTNGILLPIADFLMRHPEWRVSQFSQEDNGLLILQRESH